MGHVLIIKKKAQIYFFIHGCFGRKDPLVTLHVIVRTWIDGIPSAHAECL